MAIVLVFGGSSEYFTHSPKLRADLDYAQKRFHIAGGETPDPEFTEVYQRYAKELQTFADGYKFGDKLSDHWAYKFIMDNYRFKIGL